MKRLILIAFAGLAACQTVGPNYAKPNIAAPAAYGEAVKAGASAQAADLSAWWRQFNDPELDSLISRALAENLDLRTAQSRLEEARTQVVQARSAGLPSLSATAIAGRRDSPFADDDAASSGAPASGSGAGGAPAGAGFSLPSSLQLYSLGLQSSWQLDLFGGVRRGVEAAQANLEAADWTRRDTQVAIASEIGRAYMTLRLAQAQRATTEADIARLQDMLDLMAARSQAGVASDLDVDQEKAALQQRQAELPQLDSQEDSAVHALGILLAQPPTALRDELAPPEPLPPPPVALPVGLPSELLERRPDIRAAERRFAAATAQIGVAKADLYPKLDLLALASFASTDLGDLLSADKFGTIIAGDGSWSLFNGGRARANLAAKQAQADQAGLAYRGAILNGFKEVEDALSTYAADGDRVARTEAALATAQDALSLADSRYRAGLTSALEVLQAQGAVEQAQDQLVSLQGSRLGDLVALYAALGGGWS